MKFNLMFVQRSWVLAIVATLLATSHAVAEQTVSISVAADVWSTASGRSLGTAPGQFEVPAGGLTLRLRSVSDGAMLSPLNADAASAITAIDASALSVANVIANGDWFELPSLATLEYHASAGDVLTDEFARIVTELRNLHELDLAGCTIGPTFMATLGAALPAILERARFSAVRSLAGGSIRPGRVRAKVVDLSDTDMTCVMSLLACFYEVEELLLDGCKLIQQVSLGDQLAGLRSLYLRNAWGNSAAVASITASAKRVTRLNVIDSALTPDATDLLARLPLNSLSIDTASINTATDRLLALSSLTELELRTVGAGAQWLLDATKTTQVTRLIIYNASSEIDADRVGAFVARVCDAPREILVSGVSGAGAAIAAAMHGDLTELKVLSLTDRELGDDTLDELRASARNLSDLSLRHAAISTAAVVSFARSVRTLSRLKLEQCASVDREELLEATAELAHLRVEVE